MPLQMPASGTLPSMPLPGNDNPRSRLHLQVMPETLDQTSSPAVVAEEVQKVGSTVQVYWRHYQETSEIVCACHAQQEERTVPAVKAGLAEQACPRRQLK